jgi:hypothetical protein
VENARKVVEKLDPALRQCIVSHLPLSEHFLLKNQILTTIQSPHSPDITPCDLWLFPRLCMVLKGNSMAAGLEAISE